MESSPIQLDELLNQLENLKTHLHTFIDFNNELIDNCSLKRPEATVLIKNKQEEEEEQKRQRVFIDCSTQTDEDLIYKYAWEKFYNYFYTHQQQPQGIEASGVANENGPMNAESIKKCAEDALKLRGFVFDEQSGLYYDQNNGLYYDQEKQLYFDYKNGIYYTYDECEKKLAFHSQINKKQWSKHKEVNSKMQDQEKEKGEDESKKDIECISLQDSSSEEDLTTEDEVDDLASKYPPCIRAIVQESDVVSLGSLFIVPYTGGCIGNDANASLVHIEDENIGKVHARISYDLKKKSYFVIQEDLRDTYLNDTLLYNKEGCQLKHGDRFKVSNTVLLLHIHKGNNTCISCEPGEIIAKSAKHQVEPILTAAEREKLRRNRNLEIKKKFGLEKINFEKDKSLSKPDYKDRAQKRREEVGVDVSHIQTTQVASTSKPIGENNIGRKMLAKMGWTEGTGIGKSQTGIVEPIQTAIRADRAGLGASNAKLPLNSDESQKKKLINWNKANQRYQSLHQGNKPSAATLAIFSQEDDDADIVEAQQKSTKHKSTPFCKLNISESNKKPKTQESFKQK